LARLKKAADFVAGIVAGLFVARLWAEGQIAAVSLVRILLLAGVFSLAGFALAFGLRRLRLRAWPLLLLLFYVVWPLVSPSLACWDLGISLALLAVVNLPFRPNFAIEIPAGVAAFAAYVWTLSPSIQPADSGEFQLVSDVLGIAHPPGYPLYTLLGKLATLLPLQSPAWRVSLLSAVFAALTLALVARSVRRMTGSALAALVSALALGGITTFWAQATTANIRSLMALFTAALILLALEYGSNPSRATLIGLAAVAGLAVGHHGSLGLLFVPIAIYLIVTDRRLFRRPVWLLQSAGAFALPLLILLYLPIRSMTGSPFDPAPINSVSRFFEHVLAQGFRGDMFYFARAEFLPGRFGVWLNIVRMQFGVLLALFIVSAAAFVLVRRPKVFLLVGGIFLVNTVTAITYRAPQTVEYLIPSYVALAVLLGVGLGDAVSAVPRQKVLAAGLLVAGLGLAVSPWLANASSFQWLSRDVSTEQTARNLLANAPANATIYANWHWATPLWYLQLVEGERPDVGVIYVNPEGSTSNAQIWIRRIGEGLANGPVLVTSYFYDYAQTPYRFVRVEGGWRALDTPLSDVPANVEPLDQVLGGKIRILGYQVSSTQLAPSSQLSVRVYWQAVEPLDGDYAFFVHLVNQSGELLGQSDLRHSGSTIGMGEVVADEHQISLLPTALPGDYQLLIGAYVPLSDGWQRLAAPDGTDALPIASVQVQPSQTPAVSQHPMQQHFAGGLTLLGVDWDVGGSQTLYLHWRNQSLAAGDYAVEFVRDGAAVAQDIVHVPAGPACFTSAHAVPYGEGWLSFRLRDVTGASLQPLGPWDRVWRNDTLLPHFAATERYVSLGGEMLFTGLGAPLLSEVQAGGTLRVMLKFLALKPIVRDYSVSLAAMGDGGSWSAQDDATPALGAIPTLKWTRGVSIDDPRVLEIPAEALGSAAALQLTVYDAFTLAPLPVLDAELARRGEGQQLTVGQVSVR
jgi:hypothetical protein